MILLLLGTNPYPFNRLLHAVDVWAKDNNQQVIAQTGHTTVEDVSIECHDFVEYNQVVEWIKMSEFVICQGGFGSIKDCMKNNKTVIAAPRMQEYGECQDSQKELVDALAEDNRIIPLYDVSNLSDVTLRAREFVQPKGEVSKIPQLLENIVNDFTGGNS